MQCITRPLQAKIAYLDSSALCAQSRLQLTSRLSIRRWCLPLGERIQHVRPIHTNQYQVKASQVPKMASCQRGQERGNLYCHSRVVADIDAQHTHIPRLCRKYATSSQCTTSMLEVSSGLPIDSSYNTMPVPSAISLRASIFARP